MSVFSKMTTAYDDEQHQLANRVADLESFIEQSKGQFDNASRFLALVRKYTDIQELDAEIIRTFIKQVVVYKADKSNGRRRQFIDVEFNFIGKVILPKDEKMA